MKQIHYNKRAFLWKTIPGVAIAFSVALALFWSMFVRPSPTIVFDFRRDRYNLHSHDAWEASSTIDPLLMTDKSPCISPYAYSCGNWTQSGDYLWDNIHHVFRRVAIEAVATIKWAPDESDEPFSHTYRQCIREILRPVPLDPKRDRAMAEIMLLVSQSDTDVFSAIVGLGEHALFPLLDWHIDNGTMTVHPSMWIAEWQSRHISAACRWLRSSKIDFSVASCEDTVARKHSVLMQLREKVIGDPVPFPLPIFSTLTRGSFDQQIAAHNVSSMHVFSISKIHWLAKMFEKPDPALTQWLRVAVLLDIMQYSTTLMRNYDDRAADTPYYSLLTPDPLEDITREYPPWVHGWGPHALSTGVATTPAAIAKARSAAEESCRWLLQELAPGVVGKYMRPDSKVLETARRIFENIKSIIAKDVERANGLSPEWKAAFKERVKEMQLSIGFPYEGTPSIKSADPLWVSALAWRTFHRLRDPINRVDWPGNYHPETVDASYNVRTNVVYLPFALLHPPYFDLSAPVETHYARLGFTLAHEAMHGLTASVMYKITDLHKDYMVQKSFSSCFTKNYPTFIKEDDTGSSESISDMMGLHWAWSACLENRACAKKEAMRAFAQVFTQMFCTTRGAEESDPHGTASARADLALSSTYDLAGRNLMQQAWGCDAAPQCSILKR